VKELSTDPLLEQLALFKSQGVGLGNDRHDIHNLAELLEDNHVDGTE